MRVLVVVEGQSERGRQRTPPDRNRERSKNAKEQQRRCAGILWSAWLIRHDVWSQEPRSPNHGYGGMVRQSANHAHLCS